MLRKIFIGTLFGLAPLAALLATGCASNGNDQPNALTGNSTTMSDQERTERARWTDSKGRYRADMRQGGGTPFHYIP